MTFADSSTLARAVDLQKTGNLAEAERLCREVLAAQPASPDALHRLGSLVHKAGRFDEAIDCFRLALNHAPDHVAAIVDLAHALGDAQRFEEALTWHRRVVEMAPDIAQVHYNLACALHQSDRLGEAADSYRDALELEPDFADAHLNLGIVLREMGLGDEALKEFDCVLRLRADDPQAHLQRALTRLQAGDFAGGWDEYEWRWRAELTPRACSRPLWDGTPLEGRSLFIHGEQGVGDEIQFASCIPEIARQANRCVVECDPRLVPLFARSFPLCDVVPRRQTGEHDTVEPRCDLQIPLATLPCFVRRTAEAFPRMRRYLKPDVRLVAKWRSRYTELGTGLKVGIAWLGGSRPDFRRRRSTKLDMWMPVLKVEGVQFINLQHGEKAAELAALRQRHGVTVQDWHDSELQRDVDNTAARIAALDQVITVDNSTAHLAGALGVPVWTLLPAAADSRWMLDRTDTLWYASMNLFRQQHLGDWSDVFVTVTNHLQELASSASAA